MRRSELAASGGSCRRLVTCVLSQASCDLERISHLRHLALLDRHNTLYIIIYTFLTRFSYTALLRSQRDYAVSSELGNYHPKYSDRSSPELPSPLTLHGILSKSPNHLFNKGQLMESSDSSFLCSECESPSNMSPEGKL
ncbi:hypothetical protein K402DRAFT_100437 [Aulographum hederae CBS 113979]|uniref:Uncharacterized protein n=1 Tax=Aulographum hederae CBS 113979 TaxID=1176131 RepID=A0A6G1GY91_9PEZI|nr:hypothetical protein K402DRAFT_100437 [Aulographum hederae CBS 113979]